MHSNPPHFRHRYLDLRPLNLQLILGSREGRLLGWGMYQPKWWRNYLHSHSFYEVCFVFHGLGCFRVNDELHTIRKGDLFLARPGEIHEIIADEKDPLGIYYWSFTLPTPTDNPTFKGVVQNLLSSFRTSNITVAKAAEIEPVLQLITVELNALAPGFTKGVQGLGQKLFIDTLRFFSEPIKNGAPAAISDQTLETRQLLDPQLALANDMIQFLHDNYQRPIKVKDVAAQIHLSERHANRQFKLATGRPMMSYLTEIRIEKAKELLLNPNLLIGNIAFDIGIEDVRYFSTLFRKHTSLSPTAYRQLNGTIFVTHE